MANSLTTDGYDAAIPFAWLSGSRDPNAIITAGQDLYSQIVAAAAGFTANLQKNDIIDVHLIGHSRGAVVIGEAMQQLAQYIVTAPDDPLSHGYLKMTLLDPHPANNDENYGLNADITDPITLLAYSRFQSIVADGPVIVPARVNMVEDFYQQTPADQGQGEPFEAFANLHGLTRDKLDIENARTTIGKSLDLTGYGMGHTEIHDWYQKFVVPNLASGKTFIFSPPLQATYIVYSPVALLIVDPQGNRLGYDPVSGAPVNDFGTLATDSGSSSEPETFAISMGSVVPGLYQISGVGTGSGPYHIELKITSENNPSQPVFDQFIASGIATPGQPIAVITPMDVVKLATRHGIIGRVAQTGQWWVGQSNGSSFSSSLGTTWSNAVAWADVHTGDFNGDGLQDIAGRVLQTGQWWVSLSNGSGGFSTSLWDTWSTGVTWVYVKVGDFNGDGKLDIVGWAWELGQWWMAQSTGSSFVNSLWATWSPAVTWVDVKVGDFNGDGKADITGRSWQGGSWWTGISTGASFSTSLWTMWNPNVTWVDVNVGDFNGDGKADLVGRVLQSGQWWVGISAGSSFTNALWTSWNPVVTWVDVKVGDFNGDGKDDIIGRVLENGQWWAGISTASTFTNSLWSTWSNRVTWVDVQVGDFNGDRKSDITGRALESGQWWTGLSNGSAFTTSLWATWSKAATWVDVQHGFYG